MHAMLKAKAELVHTWTVLLSCLAVGKAGISQVLNEQQKCTVEIVGVFFYCGCLLEGSADGPPLPSH